MERILSQAEIAELLSAVREGDISPEPDQVSFEAPSAVSRLDLVRAHAAGQIRINNLDLILDSFARNFAISLTNRVQQPMTIKRAGIESSECELFLHNLPTAVAIGAYKLEPLRWGALLTFDANLAYGLVEVQLGGTLDGKRRNLDRALSAIEMNILHNAFADASQDLAKALGDLTDVQISLLQLHSNPRLVNIIPGEAMTVVATLDVEINKCQGKMQLVLPTSVLDPLREKLQAGREALRGKNDTWRKVLTRELEQVPTQISAQLGKITLEMRDFLNFQVGDVIDLPWKPSDPLTVMVEGQPKYMAHAGVRNGNKALRIIGTHQEGVHHGN